VRYGSLISLLIAVAAAAALPDSGSGRSAPATCFGRQPTIVAERFHVRGTPGDDVVVSDRKVLVEARGGDDLICLEEVGFSEVYGGAGDDRIAAGLGEDLLYPGAGNDILESGAGNDLVTDVDSADDSHDGGAGKDRIRFSAPYLRLQPPVRVDLARGRARGHGLDRLAEFERVEGTAKPDVLRGSGADELLDGVRGGDRIVGRGGADIIFGARQLVTEAGPADRFDGSDPSLRGGAGPDRIFGGAGSDRLSGGSGADLLDGGVPDSPPGDGGHGGGGRDRCRELEAARGCER
jgi:Ca2+-binding RTX toxin-like protein